MTCAQQYIHHIRTFLWSMVQTNVSHSDLAFIMPKTGQRRTCHGGHPTKCGLQPASVKSSSVALRAGENESQEAVAKN